MKKKEDLKINERRVIYYDDLRQLCISNNWYTKGDCNSYSKMLSKAGKSNITTNDIVEIAKDIYSHSNLQDMDFTSLCFMIADISYTFFYEV